MATVDVYAEIAGLMQTRQALQETRLEALRLIADTRAARRDLSPHIEYTLRRQLTMVRQARARGRRIISATRRQLADNAGRLRNARARLPGSYSAIRRQARRPAWFGELDRLIVREAAHLCRLREAETGFPWHIDHHYPLCGDTVSGLHVGLNLQVIPAHINMAKGNQAVLIEPLEWLSWD